MMSQNGHMKIFIGLIIVGLFLTSYYYAGEFSYFKYVQFFSSSKYSPELTTYFSYLNGSDGKTEGYLVYSPSCRIPDVDPFDKSIEKFIVKETPKKCPKDDEISWVTPIKEGYVLHINTTLAKYRNLTCCFQRVERKTKKPPSKDIDKLIELTECEPILDSVNLTSPKYEIIRVKCFKRDQLNQANYTAIHLLVHKKKLTKKPANKMSVMIVGVDTVSRLNFLRSMPKTAAYFEDNGWIEYKGYNKIDDNTFPNLVGGVLSGLSMGDISRKCWKRWKPADDCPYLWKNFSDAGYITAYSEDEVEIATFNYLKAGFEKPPTDFYLRPYFIALQKYLKAKESPHGLHVCLGDKTGLHYVLESAHNLWASLPEYSLFGLFWTNVFHEDINLAQTFDLDLKHFFQKLDGLGALENTFIVFLSDHGMRFGEIRETYVGWLEERLPMLYFWVPQQFRTAFPEKYNNLRVNSGRLTSPFDLHMTLLDVLEGKVIAESCPTCTSLFNLVPWNRSCNDAGISDHWCTCSEYKAVPVKAPQVKAMADFVVSSLNSLLQPKKLTKPRTQCATLKLSAVQSARMKVTSAKMNYHETVLVFSVTPGNALFEATVQDFSGNFSLVSSVSRLNIYGSLGDCIDDSELRKYCYCVKRKIQKH